MSGQHILNNGSINYSLHLGDWQSHDRLDFLLDYSLVQRARASVLHDHLPLLLGAGLDKASQIDTFHVLDVLKCEAKNPVNQNPLAREARRFQTAFLVPSPWAASSPDCGVEPKLQVPQVRKTQKDTRWAWLVRLCEWIDFDVEEIHVVSHTEG